MPYTNRDRMRVITVQFPEPLLQRVEQIAREQGMARQHLLRYIVEAGLKVRGERLSPLWREPGDAASVRIERVSAELSEIEVRR